MTQLEIDYKQGSKFWLGKILNVHHISNYSFLEYEEDDNTIHFSCYIKGNRIGVSYETLDEALAGVIAFKYDGSNADAPYYFKKMIGNEEHEDYKHYIKTGEA